MIWIVFAAMTVAALLCVLWPILRPGKATRTAASDLAFYRGHLAELEEDVARGLLPEAEARAVRAELGRRLLATADRGDAAPPLARPRLRIAAAVLVLGFVPACALALYLRIGHPAEADLPLAGRVDADRDLASAVAKIEAHVSAHPDDGRGYAILAPIYFRAGRYQAAAEAYANVIRVLGETPERESAYGLALVLAGNGVVTATARTAFQDALRASPGLPQARFFLGLAAAQAGDQAQARDIWTRLAADKTPDPTWTGAARTYLAALDKADAGATAPAEASPSGTAEGEVPDAPPPMAAGIAALPPEQRMVAIRGMVEGLAARLAQNGRDPEGWLRLVRAYSVLGDTDKARQALQDARRMLKDDGQAMSRLDGLAHELGLEG
jgi:cytochrome c-type biogenesis protein CcmH